MIKMILSKRNFIFWLFGLDRWKKYLLQIAFDSIFIPITFLFACFMRFENFDYLYHLDTYIGLSIATATTLLFFRILGLYKNVARYISTDVIFNIAAASSVSCVVLLFSILFLDLELSYSVCMIYAIFVCIITSAVRLYIRYLGRIVYKKKQENIAIYGAGKVGVQLLEALGKNSSHHVSFFIDDNHELDGKNLGGVPIYNLDDAMKKFKKLKIETLLLAVPNNIDTIRQKCFEILSDNPIKLKSIPSISSLISGTFEIDELKDIKIEDLLGRKPVQPNHELMAKTIAKKTVLITGAGGSIGSELCRQIIMWNPRKIIILDISEFTVYTLLDELKQNSSSNKIDIIPLIGSVQDSHFMKKVFHQFQIDTIYHAAAYKHVPLMELNVMQCISNNVFGTLNMAELASAAKVKHFILISTDKAVNPTNFMGASKRIAEIICQTFSAQKTKTCFSVVRFGNVLGSSGSVVPLFKKQIKTGGPITLTHPNVSRYFMTIPEAAQLVIQAGSIAKGGDIFVLDMGEPIRILDLAKKMVALSGLRVVSNGKKTLKDDEIAITVTGLRPGEKLHEELSYSKNLMGTVHPLINSVVETLIKSEELHTLLTKARDAIRDGDHKTLYKVIASVTNGVSPFNTSVDLFIQREESDKVIMLPVSKN